MIMDGNPELPETPSVYEIPGYFIYEFETEKQNKPSRNILTCPAKGDNLIEDTMTGCIEDQSESRIQREIVKKDILMRLNRKIQDEYTKAEWDLATNGATVTVDGTNKASDNTMDNDSVQETGEDIGCSVIQVDVNEEQPKHAKFKETADKVPLGVDLNPPMKTKSMKSKIPTRVIRVRPKKQAKSLKTSNFKKSKIPIRVKCKIPDNSLDQPDLKKYENPIRCHSPLAEIKLNNSDLKKCDIAVTIQSPEILLPVVVKESGRTVTIATLVDVKVSRLSKTMRAVIKKLKRTDVKKTEAQNSKAKKVKLRLVDDIYRLAMSGDGGKKSRLPMPIRLTKPVKPSRIPLAFSRFPNPDKVRKITLLRRVKKAITKKVAKINWSPKLTFPNMEAFFQRILGSNKVGPINV